MTLAHRPARALALLLLAGVLPGLAVAQAPIPYQEFHDEVGDAARAESRSVFTSQSAYQARFGHKAPAEVDFASQWVAFYSAGEKPTGGYRATIAGISRSSSGNTLKVVTSLASPGGMCQKTQALTRPYTLVRFTRPSGPPEYVQYYRDDTTRDCKLPSRTPSAHARPDSSADDSEMGEKLADQPLSRDSGDVSSANAPSTTGQEPQWEMSADPAVKSMGRLVVNFPQGAEYRFSEINLFQAGAKKRENFWYGDHKIDLMPGSYDVTISKARVTGVPIQAGTATRLKVGLLRIQAGERTRIAVHDANKQELVSAYGTHTIALPPGKYYLKMGTGWREIEIRDGQTSEF